MFSDNETEISASHVLFYTVSSQILSLSLLGLCKRL